MKLEMADMKYPKLTYVLKEMFSDNYEMLTDAHVKPKLLWVWPDNADELEEEASRLTREELFVMAGACEDEITPIVEKHKCQKLDQFLDDVFDGDLTPNFIKLGN